MELLLLLVERDGNVVTRQEIVERLWGKNVFLDTEHGVNTAIRKVRTALRDDAEKPKFIQTVTGKGYRFVSPPRPAASPAVQVPGTQNETEKRAASPRRWIAIVTCLVLAASLLGGLRGYWVARQPKRFQSIAVLPLANLSGDPAQEYFADGMTDELITMLARNTSLRVISRTSVMQYKGAGRPLRDIARELGAEAILEGSVTRNGSRVHLNLQLINAQGDSHIWAESYDRDLRDAYMLSSESAKTVGAQLHAAPETAKPQRYISQEAHDAYLRGRFFWFAEDYERSLDDMKQALDLQPDYAAAWSGLADGYAVLAVAEQVPPREVMEKAKVAVQKALELDDLLPEAHTTMGALHLFYDGDWKGAEEESLRAVQLNPEIAEAHHLRAYVLIALNRPSEALEEQKTASRLDPLSRPFALGFVLTLLRQYDAAIEELQARKKEFSRDLSVRMCLSEAYRLKGMQKEAAQEFEDAVVMSGDLKFAGEIKRAFESKGQKGIAEWRIQRRKNPEVSRTYLSPLTMAHWQARAGNRAEALKFLEEAYKVRSPFLVFIQCSPDFDWLHQDSRYQEVVRNMGLNPRF